MASPFLLGFFIFYIIPFIISISYTFTTGRFAYAGFKNYLDVFASSAFRLAAWNTIRFILIGVPLAMVSSLFISLLLYRRFYGSQIFRTILLSPMIVPVASIAMFIQVFFADGGIVNSFLTTVGIPVQQWLGSDWAFVLLIILFIWKNIGYNMVLILAGLKAIPGELIELAALEGANRRQTLLYVTLPMLRPTLFFVTVISIVNVFKSFREAFILGGEIPHKSIYMLQHFINNNFAGLNYSRLSVAAFLIFIVLALLVLCLYRVNSKLQYEMK
ncbi:MAG: sugar ABC transporter permease [Clostridiales bacterium]|nr:sugar ABC transporter permease [Clostridiales bacterium]